ncbi:molecular chaperone DnaJ [Ruegeria sp. ANG-S4]|uniref:J domain-containing protein n=1 Tax=Ruegeria sp. ANG-S4 TaxID=1577904 RepID=UPI00057C6529|nr:J domain-containing protein [Ruegeria sp. ANG-S4]KIC46904.1 molecular chaperone DnaJ [Ruegeria sp. ANG-S4]
MEPVDKINARAEALRTLGLSQDATANDIRNAWREVAFRAHPDHTGGDYSGFSKAKIAYDFLRKEGLTAADSTGPAQPRRPKLKKRLIDLAASEIEICRDMLRPDRALCHMAGYADETPPAGETDAADHVPDAVGCFGRELTYFVTTPVCEGPNRVALPTSVLSSGRKSDPEILSFQSRNAGPGEVVVPDTIRERKFPGAKSVKIRFEADHSLRDAFWLAS